MAFRLPAFNLVVHIWRAGNPVAGPPDVITTGNLSPGKIVSLYGGYAASAPSSELIQMWLRLPALADVRDGINNPPNGDIVEAPAFTGRYYRAIYVDDIAKGFPNEHRFAILERGSIPWPMPYP